MSLTLEQIDFLTTDRAQPKLAQLAASDVSESQTLSLITQLRVDFTLDEASALLTMARLRQKAGDKFGESAQHMLFTASGLEQASDPLVRQYRAEQVTGSRVFDLCCGIGTDTIAIARAGHTVTGFDLDPVRIAIARHNAAVLNLPIDFQVRDVTQGDFSGADAIFFDPARRDEHGKRVYHVEDMIPPLSLIKNWQAGQIMVKLSPGVDLNELADYGGRIEFISVNGDLKEALLHYQATQPLTTQATLIAPDARLTFTRDGDEPEIAITAPQNWLIEPDAAILRAGLVRDLADRIDATQLDETIGYLTTTEPVETGWVRSWKIREWMPFHLKRLRARLRDLNVRQVTVKKRGSPLTPEDLIKQLKLKEGDQTATLVLTRYAGQPIVMICDDFVPS